ncbi:MAG: hypothetical protein JSS79_12250 [Bacteroidetes bacterium]|nr:hypothetical protein [Bacteroidota bacterium]
MNHKKYKAFFLSLGMPILTITVEDAKVIKLLEDLESLKLIQVIKKEHDQTGQKLSQKYSGVLPSHVADEMQVYITESRNEWDKDS